MILNPDEIRVSFFGAFQINLTILTTWALIFFLSTSSWLISRKLVPDLRISKWQGFVEMIVLSIKKQIEEAGIKRAEKYVGFLGSLFIFLVSASFFSIIPGYRVPTASFSTTAALSICVFISVFWFGIAQKGVKGYLKNYIQPTVLILPFNVIGEFSRTLALAIRLFGNMMSGEMMVSILLTITPLFLPVVMSAFDLFIGFVQAYIFTVLAMVYIAAAIQIHGETDG